MHMKRDGERSILFVLARDLSSPLGCPSAYYLVDGMAESNTVHVVCRKEPSRREGGSPPSDTVRYEINTGDVPVLSGILFLVTSTLYSVVLAARFRYDTVFVFQNEMLQGWIASVLGGSTFAVYLRSVPVRQDRDFVRSQGGAASIKTSVHILLRSAYGSVVGYLLDVASPVFCLTEGIRDVSADEFGLDLSDAYVFGMGIDTETFRPGDSYGRGTDHGTWTITYVGTVRDTRALDHVIGGIAATNHDVRLQIAGTGPADHIEALKQVANDQGVSDRVTWLGLVPHDSVPELLRSTDIAVSPLRDIESYQISFPAKLLEYMAAGCLVIARDLPAQRRLIEDGSNGYLYDGASGGFEDTLSRCIASREDHDAIRREARRTAEQHDWETIVEKHEAVLFG